ncbi:CxxH/CxxC protein [Laceyella sacchari]|jgi:CxxH/CxxC protein (TIGR04129 family)|uniref:CxxH/CxxC protein n=1 Tax=Laceyella sacchari TaxID=37482 RepID=A0ABY5U1U9_LACSH|nr:CxxH/CxxC protein [Laceyella sacchari]TCW39332.1 CxxH/CxxC protein (TIGR04129 family) [Laceyella sacchari]UWE03629.1 CxxH/CxxC protein [Laceyella sacchari]
MASADKKKWYACDEHVDIALDEIVDMYEQAPLMELMDDEPNNQATCFWCGQTPRYVLQLANQEETSEEGA